jgi:hypothetical protein
MVDRPALARYTWPATNPGTVVRLCTFAAVPLWHGLDIVAALELDFVGRALDESVQVPGWETEDGPVPFITTERVRAIAAGRDRFLEWIDEILNARVASLIPRATRPGTEPLRSVPADDTRDTFTVLQAARILSRDPLIDHGRESLVDALQQLRWVVRDSDRILVPDESAIAAGWLVRNDVWIPNSRIAYNKIRVTREGLLELHQRVGGAATLDLDAPATPTLVEV